MCAFRRARQQHPSISILSRVPDQIIGRCFSKAGAFVPRLLMKRSMAPIRALPMSSLATFTSRWKLSSEALDYVARNRPSLSRNEIARPPTSKPAAWIGPIGHEDSDRREHDRPPSECSASGAGHDVHQIHVLNHWS